MAVTHAIGVDLGGTKILAGVVTREGEVVRRHERATPATQDELLTELDAVISELRDDSVAAATTASEHPLTPASSEAST